MKNNGSGEYPDRAADYEAVKIDDSVQRRNRIFYFAVMVVPVKPVRR